MELCKKDERIQQDSLVFVSEYDRCPTEVKLKALYPIHSWAIITKGLYKGDIAVVIKPPHVIKKASDKGKERAEVNLMSSMRCTSNNKNRMKSNVR